MALNKVILQGRLVADPELRHTTNGVAVATFRLAVDRDFKDKQTGERKADFINVVAWRGTAEFAASYFRKGRMAIVEGQLQNRTYDDKDGNRRYTTEVIAGSIYFGDSKRDGDGPDTRAADPGGDEYAAHGRAYYAEQAGKTTDITDGFDDGELPF